MNTKKKTILAAAFVVAIIALAGIGYAAFFDSYKGTTVSSTTEFDVDYVKISLDSDAYIAQDDDLYVVFDTVTDSNGTTFNWMGSSTADHYITVAIPATPDSNDDPDTYVIKAVVGNFTYTGYTVQYKVAGDASWSPLGNNNEVTLQASTDDVSSWSNKLVQWRFIPLNSSSAPISTADDAGNSGVEVTYPEFVPGSTMTLPAITYTITATQHVDS